MNTGTTGEVVRATGECSKVKGKANYLLAYSSAAVSIRRKKA
jgi:hypothetical protein